jgi:A/G-specific adenine glycosylase
VTDVESEAQFSGDIAAPLLRWYDAHARALPWRALPGEPNPDPYRVWLSEIMLQQTTVAAVAPYFDRFTERWPDVHALASARDADLMAAWAGLGYYARARNLLACARAVVAEHGGEFPNSETGLRALPGIGAYTAAAITAIAFGVRAVVIDAKVEIREACEQITPAVRPGDFAQAMMDLGATVCTPRNPGCLACPLSASCSSRLAGIAEQLPVKPAKTAKPHRTGTAYWIERDGHVWLIQRPETGMLAGMRALPDDSWFAKADGNARAPFPGRWQKLDVRVAHVFTHFSLSLEIAVHDGVCDESNFPAGAWWPIKALDSAGLPTLFKKAALAAMAQRERR